ncbi:MAG TPA: hypothetical protein VGA61_17715 [Anaerolineae bacterium]
MRLLRILGVLTVLFGLFGGTAMAAPAGPPGVWSTDFTLLNLDNAQANIGVVRYGQWTSSGSPDAGTAIPVQQTGNPTPNTITPNGSLYYNPSADPNFPPQFTGSVVVSSDHRVAATVTLWNNLTGAQYASDAYAGVNNPATSVILPIVMAHLGPWNTRMSIQNAGSAAANVTITYVGPNAPSAGTVVNLPPNQMAIVDQGDLPASVQNFNGSAIVTSTQPLAVELDEYKTTGGVLVSYAGIPSTQAGKTILLPGFISKGVWVTDFTVVNIDNAPGTVTVNFSGTSKSVTGPIGASGSATGSVYVGTNGRATASGWTGQGPVSTDNYYGSATVTSTTNVVVVYNIANPGGGPGYYAIGYTGQSSAAATTTVAVPLIENKYSSGWLTTYSVQSADGTPANLSMVFSGNKAPNCNPCTFNMTGATRTFDQSADGFVPTGFIGGVTITASKPIVVIADQNLLGGLGDTAAGFPGITVGP